MIKRRGRQHYFPFSGLRQCPYCPALFVPKFRRQVTCGHYTCRRRAKRDGARPVHVFARRDRRLNERG